METTLEQIRRSLPDIRRLAAENVALKKENSLLRTRLIREERENRSLKDRISMLEIESLRPRDPPPAPVPSKPIGQPPEIQEEADICRDMESLLDELPFETQEIPIPTRARPKRQSALPPRSTIPSIISALAETEPSRVHEIVSSVLLEPYPSIRAMRKYCVDLLNSVFTRILGTEKGKVEIQSYVAFIVQLAKKVSWIVYEQLMERIGEDPELREAALHGEDIADEEEDL
jgi:hypothetical protein